MKESVPDWETDFELSELAEIAETLLSRYGQLKIWLLEGSLGAGKTTLVKALGRQLGLEVEATSPTFSLVNSYESPTYGTVYHLDLYRLQTLEEAVEIGLFEIVDSGYFCLIEWASAIGYQPAEPSLTIEMQHLNQTMRRLSVRIHED